MSLRSCAATRKPSALPDFHNRWVARNDEVGRSRCDTHIPRRCCLHLIDRPTLARGLVFLVGVRWFFCRMKASAEGKSPGNDNGDITPWCDLHFLRIGAARQIVKDSGVGAGSPGDPPGLDLPHSGRHLNTYNGV